MRTGCLHTTAWKPFTHRATHKLVSTEGQAMIYITQQVKTGSYLPSFENPCVNDISGNVWSKKGCLEINLKYIEQNCII